MKDDNKPISRQKFMQQLHRYQKGSITRRHFLGITGLGAAMAVIGSTMPSLLLSRAEAAALGKRVVLATWPNYHDPANFDIFARQTGVQTLVNVFGSNEEMLAKLQAGGSGWDVFVPTNYTISTYVEADLIEPLDLSRLPNYTPSAFDKRFSEAGSVNGKIYAVPKNWGTTGMAWDSTKSETPLTSWKMFFDLTRDRFSGRTIVHDYQLTTIGNALKYYGYSFNSIDPKELADAEKLLLEIKPHLFAITSDYQPPMRNGDAWLTMCWTGEGKQMNRDMPEIHFTPGKDGGEIWSDYYAVPKSAPHKDAAYALINFLLDPQVNAREAMAHGFPVADSRVNALLPKEMLEDPILHPAAELLNALEFGTAATLTNPDRAELMARFKSA
ncbi:spermidine/putrescine ABC transporter substrate-binding protein [Affinibrenneria salicis]|uniref:Spermidine/putrescine ABC transporter substrate-binding protein n=1 Tax=Affinibrenneria salicis TaxID=2590031 RepID=A0A5J5FZ08_9GAMM|nr:spermidine/putrescine ABC transporter substrate-binding protein [Affinibrenneria salicis]KAA8998447.1 spermidine/putrescine ABC transporter substrate-binding protein [Affinibrenneria salicis]